MTSEQMVSSFARDEDIIVRKMAQLVRAFGKPCRQARRFPYVQCHEYRTSHGQCNRYLVFLYAARRSDWDNPQMGAMCLYSTPEGTGALTKCRAVDANGRQSCHYMFFTPHFVKRYAERRMGNLMTDEKAVLRAIFTDEGERIAMSRGSGQFISGNGRNADKENIFVAPLTGGAAIVDRRCCDYSKFVTYLSENQLGRNQKQFLSSNFDLDRADSHA